MSIASSVGRFLFSLLVSATLLTQAHPASAEVTFAIETIGPGHVYALALDRQGVQRVPAVWQTTDVDSTKSAVWGPSLELDAQGDPHLAYAKGAALTYGTQQGGLWTLEAVNGLFAGDVGPRGLALDADGLLPRSELAENRPRRY